MTEQNRKTYFNWINSELNRRIDARFGGGGQTDEVMIDRDEWADIKQEIFNLEMLLDEFAEAFKGGLQHVIPIEDALDHESSMSCWCGPEQAHGSPKVIFHNSMDGRELKENTTH